MLAFLFNIYVYRCINLLVTVARILKKGVGYTCLCVAQRFYAFN
jgi:hypothetical protein